MLCDERVTISAMEPKKPWNLRVFESAATAFDSLVDREYRGDKGTCVTAAALLFLVAPSELRQRLVDIVKLAEGRGRDGTVLQAAYAELLMEVAEGGSGDLLDALLRELEGIRAARVDANEAKSPRRLKGPPHKAAG